MKRKYLGHRLDPPNDPKKETLKTKKTEIEKLDPFEFQERKFDLKESKSKNTKKITSMNAKEDERQEKINTIELLKTTEELNKGIDKIHKIKKLKDNFDLEIKDLKSESIPQSFSKEIFPQSDYQSKVIQLGKEISSLVEKTTNQKIKIMKLQLDNERKQTQILNRLIKDKMKKLLEENKEQQKILSEETTTLIEKNSIQKLKVSKLQIESEIKNSQKFNSKINSNLKEIEELDKKIRVQKNNLEKEVREKTEKLIKSERLSAIGELAARVAHDLRNPLAVIKASIELIKVKSKNNREEFYERQIGMIDRSVSRMAHQIEDVLDFIKPLPINIKENSLLETIKASIEKTKLSKEIVLNLPKKDAIVEFDKEKLDVVFDNLLTNANQAMDGKGIITIRILEKNDCIIIELEDSGPGIPDYVISKIFEPLVTTKQTGTGLGLASCKSVIEQHGGEISVKNNPTTFIIRIPKNFSTKI